MSKSRALRLTFREAERLGIQLPAEPETFLQKLTRETRDLPQGLLWSAVSQRWSEAQEEFPVVIEGRRFRLDIAFPEDYLGVEVDGWQYHGKHLADFKRDRERQNLLVLHGWRILRFFPGELRARTESVIDLIGQALATGRNTNGAMRRTIE